MKKLLLPLNCFFVFAAAMLLAQTNEPIFGTWRLNVEKSKYTPGPAPKNSTKRYEPYKGGVKAVQDTTTAKGDKTHVEVTAQFDGKDYPATGNPEVDTYSFKKSGERSYHIVQKKAGKVVVNIVTTVSADGKSRTVHQTGTNAQGKAVDNQAYWERVQ